ncbi:S41 family peptidase [Corynebacterium sp. LaCa117]|uniref:S41 family peptidase n=1 Tax=Corynebacterium TaxID=1716 RepID=UPI001EFA2366|nr:MULTISPECIES: S41 family peptidase [Corynebacterium]MCG7458360.1 S41 family peptidase [Corynebacterium tuberculostearicum]MCG7463141.1 S41 family peptidase [Corynebacterium tuberculostearicum]
MSLLNRCAATCCAQEVEKNENCAENFGGLFGVAFIAVLAAVYFLGPSYGGALLGKPYIPFNTSEKRINTAMVDTAAYTGIYGESEEFQRAREAFKEDPTNAELLVAAIDAASSAEVTLLTFRGLDNVRTFGEPTAGYASANVVLDYPDSRSLMLTTAKDKACTGEEFAEDPIAPDTPESELDGSLASHCGS